MDMLRILPLACGGSMMKRLIALLLLAPVVANAQCPSDPPVQFCEPLPPLTSGTMSVTTDTSDFGPYGVATWGAGGPNYATGGGTGLVENAGLAWPIPYGGGAGMSFFDSPDNTLSMGLAINGVPWGYGEPEGDGFAVADFGAGTLAPITHAGTYLATFDFDATFSGQPNAGATVICDATTPCTAWTFSGSGTGVIDVSDYPGQPDTFYVTGGTFTFIAPEPSTASLLLIGFGFAGLAVLGRRKKL
jgi:hypothetical protein